MNVNALECTTHPPVEARQISAHTLGGRKREAVGQADAEGATPCGDAGQGGVGR